jgi:hypothetical protein
MSDAAVAGEPALEVVDLRTADVRRPPDDRGDRGVDARLQRVVLLTQVDKRNLRGRRRSITAR